jgi:hypothetical protein
LNSKQSNDKVRNVIGRGLIVVLTCSVSQPAEDSVSLAKSSQTTRKRGTFDWVNYDLQLSLFAVPALRQPATLVVEVQERRLLLTGI